MGYTNSKRGKHRSRTVMREDQNSISDKTIEIDRHWSTKINSKYIIFTSKFSKVFKQNWALIKSNWIKIKWINLDASKSEGEEQQDDKEYEENGALTKEMETMPRSNIKMGKTTRRKTKTMKTTGTRHKYSIFMSNWTAFKSSWTPFTSNWSCGELLRC